MARTKTAPGEGRRWWEALGGLAGALLAIAAVVGGIYQLVLPRRAVTVSLVEGSWDALGQNTASDEQARSRWVLLDANSGD